MRSISLLLSLLVLLSCNDKGKTYFIEYSGLERSLSDDVERMTEYDTVECETDQEAVDKAYRHYRISRAVDSLIKYKAKRESWDVILKYEVFREDNSQVYLTPSDSEVQQLEEHVKNSLSETLF